MTVLRAPKATSARVTSTAVMASWPRRARETGPRAAAPPKNVWKMPPRSAKSPLNPPKPPAPPETASGPPRSYIWRFSESDRTS